MRIRFTHDVDLLVGGSKSNFGALESASYDKGEELEVKSVEPCKPPDTDMVDVTFMDGTFAPVMVEDIEILKEDA